MRRGACRGTIALALLALLPCETSRAGDDASPAAPPAVPVAKPAPPPTTAQAADAAIAAVGANDDAALKALAARDDPDPWLVAEELLARGAADAAGAFAAAASRPDVEALAGYVLAQRGKGVDATARSALARANAALSRRDLPAGLAALEGIEGDPSTVTGVRIRLVRAFAVRTSKGGLGEGARRLLDAGGLAERMGWLSYAARALSEAARTASAGGDPQLQFEAAQRCLGIEERRGNRSGIAGALADLGDLEHYGGRFVEADERFRRALALAQEAGDRSVAAMVRSRMANLACSQGQYARAIELGEAAHAEMAALGNRAGAAAALSNLGIVHRTVGDDARALECFRSALTTMEAIGDRLNTARTYANMGNAHSQLGNYAEAIACHERALAIAEEMGAVGVAAAMHSDLGIVYRILGDPTKAIECFEGALRRLEGLGDRINVAKSLASLGSASFQQGRHAEALGYYERALKLTEALGDRAGVASALGDLGSVEFALRHSEKALAYHERALAAKEALGDRDGATMTRGNVAIVMEALGRRERAIVEIDRAVADAEGLGGGVRLAELLETAAVIRLRSGDAKGALPFARRAAGMLGSFLGGLGEQQGALAREMFSGVFSVGTLAAVRAGEVADVAYFLETGRAATLLESLGGRAALRAVVLPDALRLAASEAEAAESRATAAHRAALGSGELAALRATRSALDAARDRVTAVVERIQRDAKREARVLIGRADSIDALRGRLEDVEALVCYALTDEEAVALVVTRGGARVVTLGDSDALVQACAANALDDVAADSGPRIDALRKAVVEPLALPARVTRVLLSTEGALSYVPFSALLGGREVAYTPSGTTHGHLLEERDLLGRGVLALGDPQYGAGIGPLRSGRLARLPATAEEARAVGDPVLLGAEATESGLRRALAGRPRWHAVHLACHGIVDADRPLLCALALTAEGGDDGILTAREVLRQVVPADLVVLSACETAKGRAFAGEGLLGLTRAFMFAGAPRVICSLWKVDDEATRAMMGRFYEVWNPKDGSGGLGAAAALRAAQAFIRTHEVDVPDEEATKREGRPVKKRVRPWEHPYYWAAWVLWGLPT